MNDKSKPFDDLQLASLADTCTPLTLAGQEAMLALLTGPKVEPTQAMKDLMSLPDFPQRSPEKT